MNNGEIFKTTIEGDLKEIGKCKVDILILQREIEKDALFIKNNAEIKRLNNVVANRELSLEENLSKSGEKKIETSAGWCAYRVMPDSWEYIEPVLISWCKKKDIPYYKTIEVFEIMKMKTAIINGVFKIEEVPGITITPQEPKFNYKLSGGL